MKINNNVYTMGEKAYKEVLKLAKGKFQKEKTHAIFALEKGDVTQMVSETFPTVDGLQKAIKRYKDDGFRARYHIHIF